MIKLRGNQLTGPVDQLLNCTALTQLDISSNNFSGPLPSAANIWDWQRLEALDFSHNSFEGTIPDVLTALPVVGYLNAGHNRCVTCIYRGLDMPILACLASVCCILNSRLHVSSPRGVFTA
eukprot:GHUV01046573.1.p1 GENE.GHUV01046573.1~~GHUV01046573.1.p1  ORF type:complete len:121 (-),score=20.61 GHUV01046573.1:432-794(-)